jgi:hypothetical protein
VDRHAPFVIVVGNVERVAAAPFASAFHHHSVPKIESQRQQGASIQL